VREQAPEKHYAVRSITIPFENYSRFAAILDGGVHDGVQMYFVDCRSFSTVISLRHIFRRIPGQLGALRLVLPRGARGLEAAGRSGPFSRARLQTALLPVYLRTLYYYDPVLRNRGTLLTIHNRAIRDAIRRQPWSGCCSKDVFTPERADYFGQFNFLKAASFTPTADTVTLATLKKFNTGIRSGPGRRSAQASCRPARILNGVDYQQWNPANDGNMRRITRRRISAASRVPARSAARFWRWTRGRRDCGARRGDSADDAEGTDLIGEIAEPLMQENVVLVRWQRRRVLRESAALAGFQVRRQIHVHIATTRRWRTRSKLGRTCF